MTNSKDKKESFFKRFFKESKEEIALIENAQKENLNHKKMSKKAKLAQVFMVGGIAMKALFSVKALYSIVMIHNMYDLVHRHPIGGSIFVVLFLILFITVFFVARHDEKKHQAYTEKIQEAIIDAKKDVMSDVVSTVTTHTEKVANTKTLNSSL